jgi:hypothetical protein
VIRAPCNLLLSAGSFRVIKQVLVTWQLAIHGNTQWPPTQPARRKTVKFDAYKNWRLNGEFIHNPAEEPKIAAEISR